MLDEYFNVLKDTSTLQFNLEINLEEEIPEEEILYTKKDITTDTTRHISVVPTNISYTPMPSDYPNTQAKTFSFELDTFQKIAICALERNESVLVSAHTSSGKTAVAEYAIAMALRDHQRVIYTSPIKALSNQKFRELSQEFNDVGLMTGDTTLNPEASCLVMTTEILRNMLYKGSEVIREVNWIIFDEIHYMRDRERGVVWEESIILLPKRARMVFLSATIPNADEFAEWISCIHGQVVHVVYTEKRPTPLIHYISPKGGDGMYKVLDGSTNEGEKKNKNVFDAQAFNQALKSITKKKHVDDLTPILNSLIEKQHLPSIIFSFKRKDCEKYALQIENDFLEEEEKELVRTIFHNALASLREEDRKIPLIQNILPLLLKGVGIHHSGLLPIIKEIVEILFQENLLKVLFATETFSIGLNMPAKSVVFTGLTKFDGTSHRVISSGEYIQMSGRAGRRGLDKKGVVVAMLNEHMSVADATTLFSGLADKLDSAFYLSYNMILNLMRVEGLDALFLLSRSFYHFQSIKNRSHVGAEVKKLRSLAISSDKEFKSLSMSFQSSKIIKLLKEKEVIEFPTTQFLPYLKKGRVVSILLKRMAVALEIKTAIVENLKDGRVDVTVLTNKGFTSIDVPVSNISRIYDLRVKVDRRVFSRKFKEIKFGEFLLEDPLLVNRCYVCGSEVLKKSCIKDMCYLNEVEINNNQSDSNYLGEILKYFKNERIKAELFSKMKDLKKINEIYHMDECKKMIQVLRRLEYCDENSVLVKGRVACEISTGDELILTEMMFNGDFISLPVEEVVPLLSCLVFQEWESETATEINMKNYKLLKNTVERIGGVMKTCGLEVDIPAYLKRFSYELMDVVRMWVCNSTFSEICAKTTIFEGSIIRCFRRLEELLKQLCCAARAIGNSELENLFGLGITKIKRDIVFANSLYL